MNKPFAQSEAMMTVRDAARIVGAVGDYARIPFRRVVTDSRTLQEGDLFVALRGERFDGHAFVSVAMERGAVGAIVEQGWTGRGDSPRLIRVASTPEALSTLAGAWRLSVNPHIVAVTGSNGKTSVKEMLASIFRAEAVLKGLDPEATVLATEGNLNNTLGVPMTLLRLRPGHQWAIVEMGMNHAGEIAGMTRVARPNVAVVTNVHRAHVGFFGSIEAIARAKGEVFEGLDEAGVAIIPANETMSPVLRECVGGRAILDFALDADAAIKGLSHGDRLDIHLPQQTISVRLNVLGRHNQRNAVCAAAAATALLASAEAIRQGLDGFRGVPGRLEMKFSPRGALIIDDTYNANPDSVAAAIEVLASRPGRKVLVLGDLGELGDQAPELHAEAGRNARAAGIDDCLTLGQYTIETDRAFGAGARHFDSPAHLVESLLPQLNADTTVLVKGSRFMQMERVVEELVQ
jgi:UDP-N-acetylmuramoyl-tripeptide--D-alanyl-D-alanine ligase